MTLKKVYLYTINSSKRTNLTLVHSVLLKEELINKKDEPTKSIKAGQSGAHLLSQHLDVSSEMSPTSLQPDGYSKFQESLN